jgi:VWFA-related protein
VTRAFLALGVILCLFASAAPLKGWQDRQKLPVFRAGVDLVHFDVSVLDKDRLPVRGLTAADFTILEDGRPQPIVAFAAIDVPPPAARLSTSWADVSPDVQTNEPDQNPEGRLFVVLIDDALLPGDPWIVKKARDIARGAVNRLSPLDQAAVVFSFASRNGQTFTSDRVKLLTAIDSLQMGQASHLRGWDSVVILDPRNKFSRSVPAIDSDASLRLGSMRTLEYVAETLIAAPQRRKALIFVSPGIGVDMQSDARPHNVNTPAPGQQIREANRQLARAMPEVLRKMDRGNVTVYSIDPSGLGGLEAYITNVARGLPALRNGVDPPPSYNWLAPDEPPRPEALARHEATVAMDFLVAAAANTKGRAIVNTNDFEPGLDGLFAENGSYYLLGYVKPDKNAPGSQHRVTVKVGRPDITVRTRSGYQTERANRVTSDDPVASELSAATAGPVATSELPLHVAVAPVASPGPPGAQSKPDAVVTIVLGLQQPAVIKRTPQTIDLQTAIFTPDGMAIGVPLRQTASFNLEPNGGDILRYEVLTRVAVPAGRYELRIAAHRATDGLSGSVYAAVLVPDFLHAPLSLSGVWLEASPGVRALPRDAFASILPVVPTSSREFSGSDKITAFFRVYQGGDTPLAPASLNVRMIDDQDVTVANATGAVGVERFDPATRAADHRFELPLGGMSPGRYLLTFEVTLGQTTARRDVVFTVR